MVAVHHFHNAVELTLRAIILKERIRPESELRNTNFEAMLNWVLEYGSDSNIDLPHRQHISSLTVRRNAIQHHGEEPSYSAVAESKASCESILTGAFIGFFGVDFSGFTPFHVLNNKFATELLSDAESSISKGNFSQAVAACKLLLGLALCSLSELTPDPFVFDEEHQSGAERERSTATITQHSLGRRISEIHTIALLGTLQPDPSMMWRFLRLPIAVAVEVSHHEAFWIPCQAPGSTITVEEARLAVNFMLQVCMQIENLGLGEELGCGFFGPILGFEDRPNWDSVPWDSPVSVYSVLDGTGWPEDNQM